MSQKARKQYEQEQRHQQVRNQARKIRSEVERAQDDPTYAAKRWPFELLQNAHDTGPRPGRGKIRFSIALNASEVTVKHDGALFSNPDLAALLSGGSSKDYDSEETTGRFGTGFLMTHALSASPTVKGMLELEGGDYERFSIKLNRSGDEESIVENIQSSTDDIEAAESVSWREADDLNTAEFVYPLSGAARDVANRGLERFRDALPYLFMTCKDLGSVHLEIKGRKEVWVSSPVQSMNAEEGFRASFREVEVHSDEKKRTLRSVGVQPVDDQDVSVLAVLEKEDETWGVQEIPSSLPRIFVQFPIADTEAFPLGCVLNGGFEPAKERDALKFRASCEHLKSAVQTLPALLEVGSRKRWEGIHRLARVGKPNSGVGRGDSEEEIEWWSEQLKAAVQKLKELKIVRSGGLTSPRTVAFIYPSYRKSADAAFKFDDMYDLSRRVKSLQMVHRETAQEWATIAEGWSELGVSTQRLGLLKLAKYVRENAEDITQLPLEGSAREWLADLVELLLEVEPTKSRAMALRGIIPGQDGQLRDISALAVDDGVAEKLKDVAATLGIDVRGRLIDLELQHLLQERGDQVFRFVRKKMKETLSTDRIAEECLGKLDQQLADGERIDSDEEREPIDASARLIHILHTQTDSPQKVQRCPLVKANGKVDRVSSDRPLMAPMKMWPKTAQQFGEIYPESRLLNSWYANSEAGRMAVQDLAELDLVCKTLLLQKPRSEVKGKLLEQVAVDEDIQSKDRLREEGFTQIAMLSQVFEKCKRDEELARKIMGFVLQYAAVEDDLWQETKVVQVTRDRESREVTVRKSLWPAELLTRAWIPVETEDGDLTTVPASRVPIMDYVQPEWIRDNPDAQAFLSDVLGVSQLDVQLHSHDDEKEREELENTLADIARIGPDTIQDLAGEDPSVLSEVAEEVRARRKRNRQKEKNKKFGLAVQDAVQRYLREWRFKVKLIDRGYDFDLQLPGEPTLRDGTHHFECDGRIKLEVKATRQDAVRLTPTQAETARDEGECFALCVVDLRGLGEEQVWDEWNSEEIERYASIVQNVGAELGDSIESIRNLTNSANGRDISITRADKLRYVVPASHWEDGASIEEWARTLAQFGSR